MLSALVRIQVKTDQETPSIVPVIKTKKPRKQRETKLYSKTDKFKELKTKYAIKRMDKPKDDDD